MGNIEVRTEGVSAVVAALENIKSNLDTATRQATDESGRLLQSNARANFQGAHAPGFHHVGGNKPNVVSGALQGSIRFLTPTIKEGPARYSNRSGPTMVYSRTIELGAKIDAKFAPFLAWLDAEMGHLVRKKSVTIPPRPYFTPAALALPPRMRTIFVEAWRGAIHG